ncbi:hypothetical protein E2C01_044594 [Portunus trituberculatus]|uniref:Uncharacterized protein n=1 Tax=Portunus trituberculatus TaxID=210409 RepID=A0A5B7G0G6_PORTR|nr:hypothetical protein [Portunus trituberculatus]
MNKVLNLRTYVQDQAFPVLPASYITLTLSASASADSSSCALSRAAQSRRGVLRSACRCRRDDATPPAVNTSAGGGEPQQLLQGARSRLAPHPCQLN